MGSSLDSVHQTTLLSCIPDNDEYSHDSGPRGKGTGHGTSLEDLGETTVVQLRAWHSYLSNAVNNASRETGLSEEAIVGSWIEERKTEALVREMIVYQTENVKVQIFILSTHVAMSKVEKTKGLKDLEALIDELHKKVEYLVEVTQPLAIITDGIPSPALVSLKKKMVLESTKKYKRSVGRVPLYPTNSNPSRRCITDGFPIRTTPVAGSIGSSPSKFKQPPPPVPKWKRPIFCSHQLSNPKVVIPPLIISARRHFTWQVRIRCFFMTEAILVRPTSHSTRENITNEMLKVIWDDVKNE
ncbi:hypothetical protein F5887DRAFT_918038 [Amanita rubescens]|nr:hypothetical protein F5887DRAFT_922256 [Amanita rubescens]KAF8344667.1 hypothetical protein F5887DRAFT_918038 [Amanita rubescens]